MTTPTRPQGRMIRVNIAEDAGINRLCDGAARLYFMLKPHFDSHGKMQGGPHSIGENIIPLLGWKPKRILGYLVEINIYTSVRVWKQFGRFYIHDLSFSSEQDIRADRRGRDTLPSYPGSDRMKSGTSKYSLPELLPDPLRDLLPPEVEVEVEEEKEREVEVQATSAESRTDLDGSSASAPDRGNGNGAGKRSPAILTALVYSAKERLECGDWTWGKAVEYLATQGGLTPMQAQIELGGIKEI